VPYPLGEALEGISGHRTFQGVDGIPPAPAHEGEASGSFFEPVNLTVFLQVSSSIIILAQKITTEC